MLKNMFVIYTIISASEELRSKLRGSSKEKAIMGAAAPKPVLSTHPHIKLLGFLAFSHDSSLFQHPRLYSSEPNLNQGFS